MRDYKKKRCLKNDCESKKSFCKFDSNYRIVDKFVFYNDGNTETSTTIINNSPAYINYVTTFPIYLDPSFTKVIGNVKINKYVYQLSTTSSDGIGPETQSIWHHITQFNPEFNFGGSIVFDLNLLSDRLTDNGEHSKNGLYFGGIDQSQCNGKYLNCEGIVKKVNDNSLTKFTIYIYKLK